MTKFNAEGLPVEWAWWQHASQSAPPFLFLKPLLHGQLTLTLHKLVVGSYNTPRIQQKKPKQGIDVRQDSESEKPQAEDSNASISISQSAKERLDNNESMANSEVILQELRDFRREDSNTLKDIKEEINRTNSRNDKAGANSRGGGENTGSGGCTTGDAEASDSPRSKANRLRRSIQDR